MSIEFFGAKAGKVWEALSEGEKTLTQLQKATGLTVKEVSMGLGWLAKEEKLIITNVGSMFLKFRLKG
jgi:hypothetical protein